MFHRKRSLVGLIALALVVALSGGYYLISQAQTQAQAQKRSAAQATGASTALITRGDIVITAAGSGTLTASREVSIGFRSGGVLAEILVAVGDRVEAGQPLARLDDTEAQSEVAQAEINLRLAELELADLADVDPEELATAQANLASAKANLKTLTSSANSQEVVAARENLKSAQIKLARLENGPTPSELAQAQATLKQAELALQEAQAAYDRVAWRNDIGLTTESANLQTATIEYESAKAAYDAIWPTEDEIASARAEVAQAQATLNALLEAPDDDEVAAAEAQVAAAQDALDKLLNGGNSKDMQTAELNVAQARLNLESAQRALAQTTLTAPIAGIVTAIDAEVGEAVGTEAIITIADMDEPQVVFWVEESDLTSVAPGNAVSIVFEALPDYTFPGRILSIDPTTVEVDSTTAVQARASIDLSAQPVTLLAGMNAEVEIVGGEARNALLAPVAALRELGTNQYAVFVVGADGELELRPVEVGLRDAVNVQILSGLSEGETVSLGTTGGEAATSQTTISAQSTILPPDAGAGLLSGGGPGGPPPSGGSR